MSIFLSCLPGIVSPVFVPFLPSFFRGGRAHFSPEFIIFRCFYRVIIWHYLKIISLIYSKLIIFFCHILRKVLTNQKSLLYLPTN